MGRVESLSYVTCLKGIFSMIITGATVVGMVIGTAVAVGGEAHTGGHGVREVRATIQGTLGVGPL